MRIPDSTLFVGIDISKVENVICCINHHGETILKLSVKNDLPGSNNLVVSLVETLRKHRLHNVIVALESTSLFGIHIANFLSTNEQLLRFNVKVFCLNPKTVSNYKKSFVDLNKSDPIDAFVIADFTRCGRISSSPWRGSQYLALQRLTRHRFHLVESMSREKAYVSSNIYLKLSSLAKNYPFSDIFGTTSSSVITDFFSPDDIVNTSLEELTAFLCKKSRNRFNDPEEVARILQKAARDSYRLDKVLYEPINSAIASSLNCINVYKKEITNIDKAIIRCIKGLNTKAFLILTSLDGIGPVIASGIIAEIGDINAFRSNDALAKYTGLTWRSKQSGKFTSQDTHLTRTGNKYLRYYSIEAANLMRINSPNFSAFYNKKYNEVTKHQHKRALALTARKLIRLVFALLRKNQLPSHSDVDH